MIDPVRAASIRALFVQMRNTLPAVIFILLYVIAVTAPFSDLRWLACWVAAVLTVQAVREWLRRRFEAAAPEDAALEKWASAFIVHQAFAGAVWGASMFLFAHPEQPVTVALTLCALFSVVAGAVPAQAYNPRSFYMLAGVVFGFVLLRLAGTGRFEYTLLGMAAALFGVAMAGYCRIQSRIVSEALRIRFENDTLIVALQHERAKADDARHRAEQANIAKSQFLAAASHDLRQPLYALSLFSASLTELRLDPESRRVVGQIQDSIGVMEQLFNALLDLSRLEAGVVEARLEPVSVDSLFDRLSQVFWPLSRAQGTDLRLRSNGEWIRTDPGLAEQVLSNLISNALRATPAGSVLLAARRRGDRVLLEVWDNGPGIAAQDQQRIFEEYVQIGNEERDRRNGLGLGLSIARRTVKLLGSDLTVASRLDLGSRFGFDQPLDRPLVASAAPVIPTARSCATPRRVLLVEDDLDVAVALSDLLARWGIAVDAFASGDAMLAALDGRIAYTLLLSDFRLPGTLDGLAVIDTVRSRLTPTPRCVIVTGDLTADLIERARRAGIPLLHKPLQPDALRALVFA